MKNRAIWCIFLLFGILFSTSFAGIRGLGKYSGVVVFDRWDGCTLYSGVFVMYISEDVKEQLRPHAGQAVQINATEVLQPMNPGDGLIKAFKYLGPAPDKQSYGVDLKGLQLNSTITCRNGQKPAVMMEVINNGREPVEVRSDELALTLLTKRKDDNKFANFLRPFDGPSIALITRQSFWMGSYSDNVLRWGGEGTSFGVEYAWTIDPNDIFPQILKLAAGEKKRVEITFDLSEGEYEFLCGYGGGVHAGKCLASNLVSFDVDETGLAKKAHLERQIVLETRALMVTENFLEGIGLDTDSPYVDLDRPEGRVITGSANSKEIQTLLKPRDIESVDVPLRKQKSLDGRLSDLLIRAAKGDRNTKQLTAPKITVLNGESANFQVKRDEHYIDIDGQEKIVPVGLRINILPTIENDGKNIRIKGRVLMTEVTGYRNQKAEGQEYKIPILEVVDIPIHAIGPNNGTIMAGGLVVFGDPEQSGVPVLSKGIPKSDSRLFKDREDVSSRQTVLVLIKPAIILDTLKSKTWKGAVQ